MLDRLEGRLMDEAQRKYCLRFYACIAGRGGGELLTTLGYGGTSVWEGSSRKGLFAILPAHVVVSRCLGPRSKPACLLTCFDRLSLIVEAGHHHKSIPQQERIHKLRIKNTKNEPREYIH